VRAEVERLRPELPIDGFCVTPGHHLLVVARQLAVLTGSPGAGKTTVVGLVAAQLPGFCVLDMDVLLEPASVLAGMDLRRSGAARLWPAYNDMWLRLAAALSEHRPVLLFCPLLPDEVERAASRRLFATIEWAVLDCSDEARRERLLGRAYDTAAIEAAIADAEFARALSLFTISTDRVAPEQTAAEVAAWASRALPPSVRAQTIPGP